VAVMILAMMMMMMMNPDATRSLQYNDKYTEADMLMAWGNLMKPYDDDDG
jgi:hypothetical protein